MLDLDVFPEGKGAVAGQGRYPAGADVTIEATPADHWQFVNWTEGDEVLGTDAVQSYTMPPRDHTLTANFEPILYELTLLVEPSDGGEVSGAGSYTFGQEIELTATAYDGYVFVKWVDEDGEQVSDVPDFSFTMPGMGTTLKAVLQTAVPQDLESPHIGTLRYVPGGSYQRDDGPENITTVSQFYMSVHHITQAQFLDIMGDPSDTTRSTGTDDPVQWVNWYDAIAFCNKLSLAEGKQLVYGVTGITDWGALEYDDIPTTSTATWNEATMDMDADGYRLPTEAEWMWAAMGADMEPDAMQAGINRTGYLKPFAGYDGTNSLGDYAVYRGNSGPGDTNEEPRTTRPVGSKLPNELGLYDMSGNVWDWTWDWKADYPSYSLTDPTGPPSGTYRVVRGGSWGSFASGCAVAYRFGYFPHYRYYGFRVVSR
ncbi:MAG: hypothetical protein EA404_10075 [Spirochaetaceae bacterium]|nr:MAG: hypothetical protein EA404_10075 [Spirochaetaceae bacterium]